MKKKSILYSFFCIYFRIKKIQTNKTIQYKKIYTIKNESKEKHEYKRLVH